MKAQLSNYYRKQGGVMVFVYIVLGTIAELANYAKVQGINLRKNEADQPLFFSSRALSTNRNEIVALTITANNRVVADDLGKILNQEAKLDDYILQEKAKLMARIAIGNGGIEQLASLTSSRDVATDAEVLAIEAGAIIPEVPVGDDLPV